MTDEPSTDDSTDAQPSSQPTRPDATTDAENRDAGLGRRGFLKRTAAAGVAAMTGVGAATGSASADRKRVRVYSRSSGHQYYEIHMEGSNLSTGDPDIDYGSDCEPNGYTPDTIEVEDTGVGRYLDHKVVKGHVWNDGKDVYTYTGEIDYVVVKGDVSFVFDDRAFLAGHESGGHVYVDGLGSGRHEYTLAAYSGDIDSFENEPGDTDRFGSTSEGSDTFDQFDGDVWNHNQDSLSLSHGPMRYVAVDGHARVWVRFES